MKIRENHVYNISDLNYMTKSYLDNDYSVVSYKEDMVCLKKNNYGNILIHALLLVLTVWFSLGLLNICYLLFSYYHNTRKVTITLLTKDSSNYLNTFLEQEDTPEITAFLDKSEDEKVYDESSQFPIIDYLEY
ncbi:hypothetical protein [Methanosphaera sp. WGK6]|uniref:hypothetical protein n=1 Tax=Methanosphaera sp. WGK6 TaxID=1561964 RepID=UPI00084C74A2|nr:hypothetical protein [Methanosphaera sp. WGK6]OED30910.1 hypothetical protein NL43_00960 [Methanosphaera sp. WGK6]